MDLGKLNKEIEELLGRLDQLNMGNISQGQTMETVEKKLQSRIGILVSASLKNTNEVLLQITEKIKDLGNGLGQLNQAIRDVIVSNESIAGETKQYYKSLKTWSVVLGVATIALVIVGCWQGFLLNKYTTETQKLSKVAQEQIELQLQPALIANSYGFSDDSHRQFELVNIGNGAALNINAICKDCIVRFVHLPNFLESKKDKPLYFILKNIDALNLSSIELYRNSTNIFDFSQNKELEIRLEYDNINNKRYFTELIISARGVKIKKRGIITEN